MKKVKNTLYIFTEDIYLTLDGENIVAKREGEITGRFPLHTLDSVVTFSYMGASPALMGKCCEYGIRLSFCSPRGRFLASVDARNTGNVLLKRAHFRASEDELKSLDIARNFILAKVFNSRWVLQRAIRDHSLRVDVNALQSASAHLAESIDAIGDCVSLDALRGIEGDAAAVYYGVFDQLILQNKDDFRFCGRTRRPPLDPTNSLLSLFYTVLSHDCAHALCAAGLDPQIGFLHADRPGRDSLALDCVEEFRAVFVDRFVLTLINNRVVNANDFEVRETGEYRLRDSARKAVFKAWQDRKRDEIVHPFTKEKMQRGLVPFVQAQLLPKYIRGGLDAYPPFFWK